MTNFSGLFRYFTWKKALIIILPTILILVGSISGLISNQNSKMKIPLAANGNEMFEFFDGYTPSNKANQSRINEMYWNKIQYTTDKTTLTGDSTGIADITVTVPDMKDVMNATFELSLSKNSNVKTEAELRKLLENNILTSLKSESKTVSTKIKMNLTKGEDGWKLIPNADWQAAVLGSAEEVFTQYLSQYMDALVEEMNM